MVLKQLDIHRQKRESLDLTPYTKIKSRRFTDLSIKSKTINLLEDHIGANLGDLSLAMTFYI